MIAWNEDWITAMKRGEALAFEQCYQSLSPLIFGAILRICQDNQSAQDLLHDSFINAFESIDSFDQSNSFIAWLKRIAFNNTFNYIKRQKMAFEAIDGWDIEPVEIIQPDQLIDDRNLLTKLFDTVPSSHRLILWLYIVEQYSHDEIATLVNKTASYSKSIVSRSLQKFRNHPAIAESFTTLN